MFLQVRAKRRFPFGSTLCYDNVSTCAPTHLRGTYQILLMNAGAMHDHNVTVVQWELENHLPVLLIVLRILSSLRVLHTLCFLGKEHDSRASQRKCGYRRAQSIFAIIMKLKESASSSQRSHKVTNADLVFLHIADGQQLVKVGELRSDRRVPSQSSVLSVAVNNSQDFVRHLD